MPYNSSLPSPRSLDELLDTRSRYYSNLMVRLISFLQSTKGSWISRRDIMIGCKTTNSKTITRHMNVLTEDGYAEIQNAGTPFWRAKATPHILRLQVTP